MNRVSSYEKLVSAKLQDLQLPDMEASWQQMIQLLDREMPVSPDVSKGMRRGFWIAGSLAALLSVGSLLWWLDSAKKDADLLQNQPTVSQQALPEQVSIPESEENRVVAKESQDQSITDNTRIRIVENRSSGIPQVKEHKEVLSRSDKMTAFPQVKNPSSLVADNKSIDEPLTEEPQ